MPQAIGQTAGGTDPAALVIEATFLWFGSRVFLRENA